MLTIPDKAVPKPAANFIEEIVNEDILAGRVKSHVHTRLPPEPNGYLHIGHAKNIFINCGTAMKFNGLCNLRFDDTNPTKEDNEYVEAIQRDIHWLGYDWNGGLFFGSQYFDQCYDYALLLILKGKAYVCDLTQDETREYRGTLTTPGTDSPYRNRSVEENLSLFEGMRAGEYPNGARVLRAKIDMASPNINMRDPVIYRILHVAHHQTGDKWCIYPMYDFAHPIQDALEGITHSLCSLEYEAHRPLYDWVINELEFEHKPRQIEYARLNMTYTVMSKRYLRRLVEEHKVSGWDDPRMPTLCGLRRRGYTPTAIRDFITRAGVAKADSVVDLGLLEYCIREELNEQAPRAMAVLEPLKVILTNYPEGKIEWMEAENHPGHPEMGTRKIAFGRELYIERTDFMETPPPKYFRLKPEGEVRLKNGYIIKYEGVEKDNEGKISAVICSYDPDSYTGGATAGRKVKGTIHWVEATTSRMAEIRHYDVMLREETEGETEDYIDRFNPESITILSNARVEASLAGLEPGTRFQFMRQGYYVTDPDGTPEYPVFNRVVGLKDSWAKMADKE